MKFALLLTFWFGNGNPPDVYVLDSGLTGEDCIAAVEDLARLESAAGGSLSCEIDHAE